MRLKSLIACAAGLAVGCSLAGVMCFRRVNELETERDIYSSMAENWHKKADERKETISQQQDTGDAVTGNELDVAVNTHAEALSWPKWGSHRVWIVSGGEEP